MEVVYPIHLSIEKNIFVIDPFINAGIGIAYNTVSNFHSVLTSGSHAGAIVSAEQDQTEIGFAYQLGAGA